MSNEKCIGIMQTDISYIKDKVEHIENKLDRNFVRKEEFEPIKRVVYGMLAVILLGFLGGVVKIVIS